MCTSASASFQASAAVGFLPVNKYLQLQATALGLPIICIIKQLQMLFFRIFSSSRGISRIVFSFFVSFIVTLLIYAHPCFYFDDSPATSKKLLITLVSFKEKIKNPSHLFVRAFSSHRLITWGTQNDFHSSN